jgi:gamma-glutamylcyclotransferase (GGCT)/AIG2-like uncharacterized protein YtfP
MKFIFVYGSLKQGQYNFGRFGETKVIKQNVKINKFSLYDLGPFPCVVETGDSEDFVIGEIHEVSDSIYNSISRMEFGAGYYSKELTFGEISATVFLMEAENLNRYGGKLIESGVW